MKMRRAIPVLLLATALCPPVHGGQFPIELECADFGSNCEQDLPEATPSVSELTVPEGICDAIASAAVRVAIDHSWVGDLRLALEHESSGIVTVLVDRPGAPIPTTYGCPENGIEVTFHKDAALRAEVVCNDTIPAIDDEVRTAQYAYGLTVAPDDTSTFEIDDCPFTRFEGRYVPSTPTASMGCPPFFASDELAAEPCRFRGRWNDQCGDDSLEVELERLSLNRFIVRILDQALAYNFQGVISDGLNGDLTSFGVIADREIGGTLELSNSGLEALAGESCQGVWKLHVVDEAAPNTGRLQAWSLLLEGLATATPTSTATATASSTPTATDTATATPTASNTATASRTPTSSPTVSLTPSVAVTQTQTPAVATETPTALADTPTATETATSSPTVSPTPSVAVTQTQTPAVATETQTALADTPTATETATSSPTLAIDTPTGTLPTATETPTGEPATPTDTATQAPPTETPGGRCAGDCDGSGDVSIAELIRAVNIALGNASLESCRSADVDGDGQIAINELIRAVRSALDGC